MPTNSDYDGFFSGIDGIPLFTYGMIASTIVVLSYMTFMEESIPEEIQPDSSVLSAAVTSPLPPDSLTEEGDSMPQEDVDMMPSSEGVPQGEGETAFPEQEAVLQEEGEGEGEQEGEQPEEIVKQSVGGKKRKSRITKRRRPQA